MGRETRTAGESIQDRDRWKFGREQLLNIDPTRAAGATIVAKINVPRQLESLDIEHQRKVSIEGKGFQGRRLSCADITTASLIRC